MTDDDIVQRLRRTAESFSGTHFFGHHANAIRDGADEIERLRRETNEMKGYLRQIGHWWDDEG